VLSESPDHYVGNPNPTFLAGFNNTFDYKGLELSFLINGHFGGYVYDDLQAILDGNGLSQRSARARNNGGVMVNGKKVPAHAYFKRISAGGNEPAVLQYRYSATNVRLQNLSIGYTFSHIGNLLESIKLSLVGRNLFFFYKKAPFDPAQSLAPGSNVQGIYSFGAPATRSYGFGVNIKF
jgi:hypothetical protein